MARRSLWTHFSERESRCNRRLSLKIRQLLAFPFAVFLVALFIYYYSLTVPLLKPDEWDAWGKFVAFTQHAVIFQQVGSSFMIKYIPLALIILWAAYITQVLYNFSQTVKGKNPIYFFWTNWLYLAFATVASAIWILFVAFVQYYNLYYDAIFNCSGLAGYFTHWSSGFCITLILYNINLMDFFQFKGTKGRVLEVLFILGITLLVGMQFEYTEALHPERYFSELVDMQADMFMNLFGAGFAAALYQLIVPFEE